MTEIPEHLLKRSKERRAAMSGDDGAPAESSSSAPATTSAAAVPAAAAAAPKAERAAPPPKPVPPQVIAARTRKKVPFWALPVVAALPIWLFMYAEAMSPPTVELQGPLAGGEEIYGDSCASCHGGGGAGGVGRQLNNDEVLKTFPSFEDHFTFVALGSEGFAGQAYGDPNREGGQRQATTGMPAWAGNLTSYEIIEVVCHERFTMQGNDGLKVPSMLAEFEAYCAEEAPEFLLAEEEGAEYHLYADALEG